MGLWAGIKHALNSTLGTEDFQSLDNMIFSGRSTIASENPLYVLFAEEKSYNYASSSSAQSEFSTGIKFIPKSNGSFKLSFYLEYKAVKGGGGMCVKKNGNIVSEVTQKDTVGTLTTETITYKKGDELEFFVKRIHSSALNASNTFSVSNAQILATPIDVGMFKIISN